MAQVNQWAMCRIVDLNRYAIGLMDSDNSSNAPVSVKLDPPR